MLTTRRLRPVLTAFTAILLTFAGLSVPAGTAVAVTARIVGTATCQSDGTYKITLVPNAGTTFDPSVPVTVYTKVGGATMFTASTAFSPDVQADRATMVVPGEVAGTYRLNFGYIDALGVLNTVIGDTDVAGTCTADTPVAPETPTVATTCGPDDDAVSLPTTLGVVYTASGWSDGSNTVTATAEPGYTLTGTTTWTFTDTADACPVPDIEVATITPTTTATCGPDDDNVALPTTVGVTYAASGWVDGINTVTATAEPGYVLTGTTTWTLTDSATTCVVTATEVVIGPENAPTVTAVCGADNDTVNLPTIEGVIFTEAGRVNSEDTVTATAEDGYVIQGDSSWTFTDAATPCPAVEDDETPGSLSTHDNLAYTGLDPMPLTVAGLLLVGFGLVLRRRAAHS